MPTEVKILKYLLSLSDQLTFVSELERALNPGPGVETDEIEYLYTTPGKLLLTMDAALKVYRKCVSQDRIEPKSRYFHPDEINKLISARQLLLAKYMN